ncbi:MAG: PAS domain-containing protein [Acidobacteriota bacterium]
MDSQSFLALVAPVLDDVGSGITVADARQPDLPLIYANGAFERITGYGATEVVGRNCRFLQGPETDPRQIAALRSALREGRALTTTLVNYRKQGGLFWNELRLTPIRDPAGEVTHFIGVQKDVTAEVRSRELEVRADRLEEELAQGRSRHDSLRSMVEPMETILGEVRFGVVLTDQRGVISYLNRTACELLRVSFEAVRGRRFSDLYTGGEALRAAFPLRADSREQRLDSCLVLEDGSLLNAGFSLQRAQGGPGDRSFQLLLFRELESLKKVEGEMRELKRLSSLGQMAAGFAHQVRNPLAAIRSLAEALIEELDPDDSRREYGERTVALVERVEGLVRRSLRFTHDEGTSRRPVSVARLLDDLMGVLEPRWGDSGGRPALVIGRELPAVLVDPAQIVEVLVILVENALDVVRDPSLVRIESSRAKEESAMVAVEVVDRGAGMAPEILEKIFDPFFSTKPRGAGLGLAIALRLTHENRGDLLVESHPGQGTRFRLLLPEAPA